MSERKESVKTIKARQKARQRSDWDRGSDHWAGPAGLAQIKALEQSIEETDNAGARAALEKELTRLLRYRSDAEKERAVREPNRFFRALAYAASYCVGIVLGFWALRHGMSPWVAAVAFSGVAVILCVIPWSFAILFRGRLSGGGGRQAGLRRASDWRLARLALACALAPATLPWIYAGGQSVAVAVANHGQSAAAQRVSDSFAQTGAAPDGTAQSRSLALGLAGAASARVQAAKSGQTDLPGAHALAQEILSSASGAQARPVAGSARIAFAESADAAIGAGIAFPGHLGGLRAAAGIWVTAVPSRAVLHSSIDRDVVKGGAWFIPFYTDEACRKMAIDFRARDIQFEAALARAGKSQAARDWAKTRAETPVLDERVACVGEPIAVSGVAITDRSEFSFTSDWAEQASDFAEARSAFAGRAASGESGWGAAKAALAAKMTRMQIDERMLDEESRQAQ